MFIKDLSTAKERFLKKGCAYVGYLRAGVADYPWTNLLGGSNFTNRKLLSSPQIVDEPYLLVVIIHFLVIYGCICSSNPIKSTCFIIVPQNDLCFSWLNPTFGGPISAISAIDPQRAAPSRSLRRRPGCRPAWWASRMRRTMPRRPRRVTMRLTIIMNHTGLICLLLFLVCFIDWLIPCYQVPRCSWGFRFFAP